MNTKRYNGSRGKHEKILLIISRFVIPCMEALRAATPCNDRCQNRKQTKRPPMPACLHEICIRFLLVCLSASDLGCLSAKN